MNRKEGVFKMNKTIILKLLIRLTANFLLRFLVKNTCLVLPGRI